MIDKFDAMLIRFFESIAHWWQRLTGKDNFWLGWAAFWIQVILTIYWDYVSFAKKGMLKFSLYVALGLGSLMLLQVALLQTLDEIASIMRSSGGMRLRNPFEHLFGGRFMRIFSFSAFLGESVSYCLGRASLLSVTPFFFMTVMWYFFSCTPLPPGENKVSQWVKSLRSALSFKPASTGARG